MLHAKLRIVGKLIEQLTEEAALLDQEMAVASRSLKLAENDLQVFERYMAEINDQASERLQLFENSSSELTAIESSINRSKPHQCSLCNKIYASKDSIVRHLRSVHCKTKEPSEKEKKELIKVAKEKTRPKKRK